MNIGDGVVLEDKFSFAKIANVFNTHAIKSIPFYNEGHELILKYSEYFLHKNSLVYDLGCSTGTLINKIKEKFPLIQAVGIDSEINMLKNTTSNNNITFYNDDILNLDYKKSSIFILYYTLQFLTDSKKQNILKKIYNSLEDTGCIFVFEKIKNKNNLFQEINDQIYHDFKKQFYSLEEIENKSKSLVGILNINTHDDNVKLFNDIGFTSNTIFKFINFEGYILTK